MLFKASLAFYCACKRRSKEVLASPEGRSEARGTVREVVRTSCHLQATKTHGNAASDDSPISWAIPACHADPRPTCEPVLPGVEVYGGEGCGITQRYRMGTKS